MSNMRCGVIAVVGLGACGGHAMQGPAVVLVRSEPVDAGQCPFGGAVVSSGLDDNGNGILDDAEIITRTTLCHDAPGQAPPMIVVRLVAEPAGPHCALASTAVQSGPDRNANGRLDDDEVTHVDYVCGEPLLTRLAPEPPGSRCVAGGLAFQIGRDRNHDGQLEDDEVEQAEIECGDVVARDVAIQTATDAAALANIAIIAGSLTVNDTGLTELALPRLVEIRGALEVQRSGSLVHIALPALQAVDGRLALGLDPQLASIDLPALHRVGSLAITGDAALRDLGWLPALTTVLGDIQISGNDALWSVDLPVSQIGGGLAIDGNAQLGRVSWSVPGRVGAVHIASNDQLASIDLAGTAAERLGSLGGVLILSNHHLERVALDADTIDAIGIYDSPYLADVAVTAVQITGDAAVMAGGSLRLHPAAPSQTEVRIRGSLSLSGPIEALTNVVPLVVDRDCTIDRTQLASFGPDNVARVGGGLVLSNNSRLTAVSTIPIHSLEVRGNHALPTLSFQLPDEFSGGITIVDNAILESAPFDGLQQIIGYVLIDSNPALKTVFGPSLEAVSGDLTIQRNASLTDLGLTNLRHVGGLGVASCPSVTEIDMPALSDVSIFPVAIINNEALGHIRFPLLRGAEFWVFDNHRLPTCEVLALFATLLPGDHEQRGNDDAAGCGP